METVAHPVPELIGIIVLDIETTDLYPPKAQIIEIAAVQVKLRGFHKKTLLNRVCNPDLSTTELEEAWPCEHGYILPEEILGGDPPEQISLGLKGVMGNWPWTSYNSSFESRFLQNPPWRLHPPSFDLMNTMTDICGRFPRWATHPIAPNLQKAYRHIGGYPKTTHRALDDAYMAADILIWLLQENIYKRDQLANILIPPIECPVCDECHQSMSWDPARNDWRCQRCWDYHFKVGGRW